MKREKFRMLPFICLLLLIGAGCSGDGFCGGVRRAKAQAAGL